VRFPAEKLSLCSIISIDFAAVSAFFLLLRQKPGCVPGKIGDGSFPLRLEGDQAGPDAGSGVKTKFQQPSPDPGLSDLARENFFTISASTHQHSTIFLP
jgi:hypothetical protein